MILAGAEPRGGLCEGTTRILLRTRGRGRGSAERGGAGKGERRAGGAGEVGARREIGKGGVFVLLVGVEGVLPGAADSEAVAAASGSAECVMSDVPAGLWA